MSIRKRIREIEAKGWRVSVAGSGHLICRHPDAAYPVVTSATPSDRRADMALRTEMRRALKAGRAAKPLICG